MNLDFHGVISSYNFLLFYALEWSTKYIKIDLASASTVRSVVASVVKQIVI
jgi:hypothetical protein